VGEFVVSPDQLDKIRSPGPGWFDGGGGSTLDRQFLGGAEQRVNLGRAAANLGVVW
jgi:hypothetical protein